MINQERYLMADWPAPANVCAVVCTRRSGFSSGQFSSFNMGLYSGDDQSDVWKNRHAIEQDWSLKHSPQWLKQVHGTDVAEARADQKELEADAVFSRTSGVPAAVLTADCLPVVFCNDSGSVVAAAHAGWKGLVNGVLEATVQSMNAETSTLMAWMGPAIGPKNFEVGPEVREQFISVNSKSAEAFVPGEGDRWFADIYQLAGLRLEAIGVTRIYGGDFCTVDQPDLFFSYRREGQQSGRMATVVWFE